VKVARLAHHRKTWKGTAKAAGRRLLVELPTAAGKGKQTAMLTLDLANGAKLRIPVKM
jgi:hypothetical protein